ncbi:serine/arginine repetitive matrix protein 1-like [Physeter macrocephalus]|uniref:Serine/arginine repetitive matrix protein 1-like n=1 Tax=Physeter macrocephalus TaxID=9755 RepID=A0A455BX30_PHYMC|nr:serine/arginine repetitive matrix protein 1-like [Physeter catodon]|eukprot:XP_028348356.1 serine/arginine repetitive matrix protein 1-like [Physeter catodon]
MVKRSRGGRARRRQRRRRRRRRGGLGSGFQFGWEREAGREDRRRGGRGRREAGGRAEGRGVAERGSLGRGRRRREEGRPERRVQPAPRELPPRARSRPSPDPAPARVPAAPPPSSARPRPRPPRLGLFSFSLLMSCFTLNGLECAARPSLARLPQVPRADPDASAASSGPRHRPGSRDRARVGCRPAEGAALGPGKRGTSPGTGGRFRSSFVLLSCRAAPSSPGFLCLGEWRRQGILRMRIARFDFLPWSVMMLLTFIIFRHQHNHQICLLHDAVQDCFLPPPMNYIQVPAASPSDDYSSFYFKSTHSSKLRSKLTSRGRLPSFTFLGEIAGHQNQASPPHLPNLAETFCPLLVTGSIS